MLLPKKVAVLPSAIPFIVEDAKNLLTSISLAFIDNLYQELLSIDDRTASTEQLSESLLVNNDDYRRLQTIPELALLLAEELFVRLTMLSSLKMVGNCQLGLALHSNNTPVAMSLVWAALVNEVTVLYSDNLFMALGR